MSQYPVHPEEAERLEVIRGLGFEPFIDADFVNRLTELGAGRFDAPTCFIGLMKQDEEKMLACYGGEPRTTPWKDTVCTHTIARDDILITNVNEDDRFKDNEHLKEMGIEWYAGTPVYIDGKPVGTFCITDDHERELDEWDKRHLKHFAEETADQLVLRNTIYDKDSEHISKKIRKKVENL